MASRLMDAKERARILWETAICDQYRDDDRPLDPTCGDCTYCCWSHGIPGCPVPDELGRPTEQAFHKIAAQQCPYQDKACRIYNHRLFPAICRAWDCAYLRRERGEKLKDEFDRVMNFRVHRPQIFRGLIEQLCSVKGTLFPSIPSHIQVGRALELIESTGCVPDCASGIWRLQMVA